MPDPLPTFTVGVGQAGIAVVQALDGLAERNQESESFAFLTIDSDQDTLNNSPDGATQVNLDYPAAVVEEDQSTYPYLTTEMNIGVKGAERQRPVGRYKIDNRETFQKVYEEVWSEIKSHYESNTLTFGPQQGSFNIFLVHSLGGGTGSGTFPLVSAILNKCGKQLEKDHEVDVYLGGVGIAPEITFDPTSDIKSPPGSPIYYPNTFAALNDASELLDISGGTPRELRVYAHAFTGKNPSQGDATEVVLGSLAQDRDISIDLDEPPFTNYWLLGVNENKIQGGSASGRAETYREKIDNTIAEGIHAIAQLNQSAENWATNVQGLSRLGSIGHAEVRVPHERVTQLCRYKEERSDKKTRVNDEIPDEMEGIQRDKAELDRIRTDPSKAVELFDDGPDKEQEIRARLERELSAGSGLVRNNSAEDVRQVLTEIEDDYSPEFYLLATEILEEMFNAASAAPAIESSWEETVTEQWQEYDMANVSGYGGQDVTTVSGKAGSLKNYYSDKISDYDDRIEEVRESWQDLVPPLIDLFESQKEELERWRKAFKRSQDELLEIDNLWQNVQDMVDEVESQRSRANQQIKRQISSLDDELDELEAERRDLQNRIKELTRTIRSEEALLSEERTSERLGILPLRREALDDLDLRRVKNELTTLDAYVEQGFIDDQTLRHALNNWYKHSLAWEDNPVIKRNAAGTTKSLEQTRNEMWVLSHEANAHYPTEYIDQHIGADNERHAGGDASSLDYLSDPYGIEFITFTNQGPVEALRQYQNLDEMADDGVLDAMAGMYGDYRMSFAYLEWYDRDIQKAFKITEEVSLPLPPEPTVEAISTDRRSAEEAKNYLTTHLESYLWDGVRWEEYDADIDFYGWKQELTSEMVPYRSLQKATPGAETKERWLAGDSDTSWQELLDAYRENLIDIEGIKIEFE